MAVEFEDFVNALTEETTPDNAADFLVIVDTSGSDVNKVKPSNILGADLTAIKGLSPSNDDFLQKKAGAWTNRTPAQVKADLSITENATHTGDVTGATALTVDKSAITGKTGVSAAVGDSVLISDASDTDALKKATIQSIVDLVPSSNATHTGEVTGATALTVDKTAITNKTLVTAAVGDHVLVADASDSDNLKKVTVQTIVDLAGGGGIAIGDPVTSATAGSVFYAGALGVLAQSNSAFSYDSSTNLLLLKSAGATDALRLEPLTGSHSPTLAFKETGSNRVAGLRLTNQGQFHLYHAENGQAIQIGGRPETTSKLVVQGREDDSGGIAVQINTKSTTSMGLSVNMEAAQSADAIRVKDSGSADVFVVNAAGSPGVRVNSAPADGDIDSNQLFWWFDSTNGAAKAKFKGKSANGTVVSGEVALA